MEYSTTDPSRMAFMIPHVIFWAVCHRQEIICKLAFMILLYSSKEFQKTKNIMRAVFSQFSLAGFICI